MFRDTVRFKNEGKNIILSVRLNDQVVVSAVVPVSEFDQLVNSWVLQREQITTEADQGE